MVEDMTPLITATWDKAGRKFRSSIGLDPDQWKVINPHVKGKIQNATMAFCAETNATTSKLLNQALADLRAELVTGIVDEGEGLIELTKRVERVFENAETWRARRIAATENSRARHEAELESAVESEVVAGFQWLLSEGACALCYHISDQVKQMPLGENFAVIGHNEHYKNIRTPPLHPGCRCSQLAILKPEYGGPAEPKWGKTAVQPKVEETDQAKAEESESKEQSGGYSKPPHDNPLPYTVGPTPDSTKVTISDEALDDARKLFNNPELTPLDLASMAGVPGEAEVTITSVDGDLAIRAEHPKFKTLVRGIEADKEGITLHNSHIVIKDEYRKQGLGLEVFMRQVEYASRFGINRISADADGNYQTKQGGGKSGYLYWAELGFNGAIPERCLKLLASSNLPTEVKSFTKIQELMNHSGEARDWWKKHGSSWKAGFKLNPKSINMDVLSNYLRERDLEKRMPPGVRPNG